MNYKGKQPPHFYLSLAAIALSLLTIGFTIGSLVTRSVAVEPEPTQQVTGKLKVDEPVATESAVWDEPLPEVVNLGEFTVTHYCACSICCGEWADGITATGTVATEGRTIAVDPEVIPYGAEVVLRYEDGTEAVYIAEDCGGAIQGNRVDIYMGSHEAALQAGVKTATAYVLKEAEAWN